MPKLTSKNPSYRLHKPSGQPIVTLCGQDFYLGSHNTDASRREYDRLISEWPANGRRLSKTEGENITVAELVNAFRKHAEAYYVKNWQPTGEQVTIKNTHRFVLKLYPDTHARDFGPLSLKAVREAMIQAK